MKSKSSLLYWFPKTEGLGIPIPRTEIVRLTHEEIQAYERCEGDSVHLPHLEKELTKTIRNDFSLPVFIRTDEYSGKHSWNKTCFLEDIDNLPRNLAELISQSMMADFLGKLPLQAIVVREFIPMDSRFTAFMGEMPVNPERRYFIRNGQVECHHPYWIEDAVAQGTPKERLIKNWRTIARQLNKETPEEIKLLTDYSIRVARAILRYWSIDFCRAKNGIWYLIDMAEGEKSFHLPGCKYSTMPWEPKRKRTEDSSLLNFLKRKKD